MEELTIPERLTLLALAWYDAVQSKSSVREDRAANLMEDFIREHWKDNVLK